MTHTSNPQSSSAKTQILQPIGSGSSTLPIAPSPVANQAAMPIGATPPPAVPTPATPQMKFTSRKKARDGIASDCKQLVIVTTDISSSMTGSKIDEVNAALPALLNVLTDPVNKNGFVVGGVSFNGGAQPFQEPELATLITMPTLVASGGTNFDSALLKTLDLVTKFAARPNPEGWDYQRAQVLFLSDGYSNVSDKNIEALQEMANVTAIAFGSHADEGTLGRIASDGNVHYVGANGSELRKFLAQVGQTLSQELAKK